MYEFIVYTDLKTVQIFVRECIGFYVCMKRTSKEYRKGRPTLISLKVLWKTNLQNIVENKFVFSLTLCSYMVWSFPLGHGMLVLGQEQDHRGGGYSPQESFVGQVTLVNVWAELLPPDQIFRTFTRCDRYIGSLVGWPDFQWGIKGQVVVSARLFFIYLFLFIYVFVCVCLCCP